LKKENRMRTNTLIAIATIAAALLAAAPVRAQPAPAVSFTTIARCGAGNPRDQDAIAGRVHNLSHPENYRVVIYSLAGGQYWVQPYADQPLTLIQPDGQWSSVIFLGQSYTALVVRTGYGPAPLLSELPPIGGDILSFATTPCRAGQQPTP
jgi:hypothetical protein